MPSTTSTPTSRSKTDHLSFAVHADVAAILSDVGNALTAPRGVLATHPRVFDWVAERHPDLSDETLERLIEAVDALVAAMWDRHDPLVDEEAE